MWVYSTTQHNTHFFAEPTILLCWKFIRHLLTFQHRDSKSLSIHQFWWLLWESFWIVLNVKCELQFWWVLSLKTEAIIVFVGIRMSGISCCKNKNLIGWQTWRISLKCVKIFIKTILIKFEKKSQRTSSWDSTSHASHLAN